MKINNIFPGPGGILRRLKINPGCRILKPQKVFQLMKQHSPPSVFAVNQNPKKSFLIESEDEENIFLIEDMR